MWVLEKQRDSLNFFAVKKHVEDDPKPPIFEVPFLTHPQKAQAVQI